MQQRTRRFAMVFGGSLVISLATLAACSTDNGTTPLPGTGVDSGRTDAKGDGGTNNGEDGDTPVDDSGNPTGADCGNAPRLRSNDLGFRCSFFTRDGGSDAGSLANCYHDETCCNPGAKANGDFGKSFCADSPADGKDTANGDAVCAAQAMAKTGEAWEADKSSHWECADKNNCGDNEVCCMFTWVTTNPADKVNIGKNLDKDIPASCNALQAFKQGGTRCAATCNADEIKLCSNTDQNCQGSEKCTPFSALFRDLGTCRQ